MSGELFRSCLNLHRRPAVGAARRDPDILLQHRSYPQGVHGAEGKNLSTTEMDPVRCRDRGKRVCGQNRFPRSIEDEQVRGCQPPQGLADVSRGDPRSLREGGDAHSCSCGKPLKDPVADAFLLCGQSSAPQAVRNGLHAIRKPHFDSPRSCRERPTGLPSGKGMGVGFTVASLVPFGNPSGCKTP